MLGTADRRQQEEDEVGKREVIVLAFNVGLYFTSSVTLVDVMWRRRRRRRRKRRRRRRRGMRRRKRKSSHPVSAGV